MMSLGMCKHFIGLLCLFDMQSAIDYMYTVYMFFLESPIYGHVI